MPDLDRLRTDLHAEHEALDAVVAPVADDAWDVMTPAEPWTVRDQISHLTFFDRTAAMAVADPEAFAASLHEAASDIEGYMNSPLEAARALAPSEVLHRWRVARSDMLDAFARLDGGERVPWYGPPMSPASFMSARLMETWAHGQDIVDALGLAREPSERLRHIVHLGVRARPYCYAVNDKQLPGVDVGVDVELPTGERLVYDGSPGEMVSGPAEDFCLVVTQRRHIADTALEVSGPAAEEWMAIAQCFAGAAGSGRQPGQFPREESA